MSWKLAELKWRQELGLYESRWERDSGPLPLERKHAVQVFERQRLGLCRKASKPTEPRSDLSPERHSTRLGNSAPPALSSIALSASPSSPAFPASSKRTSPPLRSTQSAENSIDASVARNIVQGDRTLTPPKRAQSCCQPTQRQAGVPSPSRAPLCSSSLPPVEDCEDFSFLLPAFTTSTPQPTTSREELTRLLNHADLAPSIALSASQRSLLSSIETARVESCSHISEAGSSPSPTPPRLQALRLPAERLTVRGTTFEILGDHLADPIEGVSTTHTTTETLWPRTISRHNSTSSLLPKTSMSPGTNSHSQNGDFVPNGESRPLPPSGDEPVFSPPVRRTTPIYATFDQAHESITRGLASARLDSDPGTDSLNNVYARAMADEAAGSVRTTIPASEIAASYPVGGPVRLPFQRCTSPETHDHINIHDAEDNNPAGMHVQPNDVPLQPILRTVPRSSVTYSTSMPREPAIIAFEEVDRIVRDRASSVPMRSPTPFPARATEQTVLNSSVDSFVDQYGNDNEEASSDDQSGETAVNTGDYGIQPRQGRSAAIIGPPPAWPLPVEPAVLLQDTGLVAAQSSSPPTYGATTDLLAPRPRPASNLRDQIVCHPQRALARSSSVYSSELDELIARRGNSSTPFNQIGDPGPAVDSSRLSSPAPAVLPRVRQYQSGPAAQVGHLHAQDDTVEPSSSSGIGIALTSSNDPVVRYDLSSNFAGLLPESADQDDDGAWETTQGTNTQRNSAVPEVDFAAFSSSESLGRQATSTWDPLAANMRGLAEAEREFAELQAVRSGTNGLGGAYVETPEHSMPIASLDEQVHAEFSTSVVSPEQTFTTTTTTGVQQNNHHQQSLPGSSLLRRTPRTNVLPSDTIVNMSSETASDVERATYNEWAIEEIRRYEPRRWDDPPRRQFPGARLTTDRHVLAAENDDEFVRRQHRLARFLIALGIIAYPFGGFGLVNSLANDGEEARGALVALSGFRGGIAVNNVHPVDRELARRAEQLAPFGWVALLVALVAVLAWALA